MRNNGNWELFRCLYNVHFSIAIENVSSRDYFGNSTNGYRAFLQHQTEYINEKSQDEKKVSVHLPNYLHHSRSFSFQSFDDPLKKFHNEENLVTQVTLNNNLRRLPQRSHQFSFAQSLKSVLGWMTTLEQFFDKFSTFKL